MSCKSVLSVCSDLTERERGEVVTIGSSRKKSHVWDRPEGRRGTRDDDGLRGKKLHHQSGDKRTHRAFWGRKKKIKWCDVW